MLRQHRLPRKVHPRVVRMLPNTELVAVGYTFVGVVEFWNQNTFSCVYTLKAHSASVNTIIFSADSRSMYSASENRAVKVWDLSKALAQYLPTHTDAVSSTSSLAPQPEEDLSIYRLLKEHETHFTEVEHMLVLKGGTRILTAHGNQSPVIVNLERGGEKQPLEETGDSGGTPEVVESAEGYFVYGLSQSKTSNGLHKSIVRVSTNRHIHS